jgi:Protein of unknown function (DUF3558)
MARVRGVTRAGSPWVLIGSVGVGLALVLAACGSGTSTIPKAPSSGGPANSAAPTSPASPSPASVKPAAAEVDSCTAITRSEVAAAIGHAVRSPVRGRATVEGGVACVFYEPFVPVGTNPDVPVAGSVRVVLVRGADAKKFFDDYRSKVPAVSESGLGDEAFYDGSASLSVLKGTAYIRIAAVTGSAPLAVERVLARDALPRM